MNKCQSFASFRVTLNGICWFIYRYSRLLAIGHLCPFYSKDLFEYNDTYSNESIYQVIRGMALQLPDTMFKCMWEYKHEICSHIFVPILTDLGLCFAYNSLNDLEIYTEM